VIVLEFKRFGDKPFPLKGEHLSQFIENENVKINSFNSFNLFNLFIRDSDRHYNRGVAMPEPKKPEDENVPEDGSEESENLEEKGTGTHQDKSERTFSQAEVDRLIQNRLRKEKNANQATIDALTADTTFYEEQFAKVIEAQTADWDEGMRELFNALPVRERLEKLSNEEFMGKVRRKNVPPKTPSGGEDGKKPLFTRRQSV
jgi:hypothetical protein